MAIVVTCNGCFDGLHPGHLFFLGYCAAQGDKLFIGVNSDDYIRRVKGREPVPLAERISALTALGIAESVECFDEDDPRRFIERINPSVHCIGGEYGGTAVELETCRNRCIGVVWVPRVGSWSTTAERKVIQR